MKNIFPGYYRPTEDDLKKLTDECVFSFDANILLHIYRFTNDSRETFFQILEKLGDRVWITYQAAEEFQRGRLGVIAKQEDAYNELIDKLKDTQASLTSSFNVFNKHPLIKTQDYLDEIGKFYSELTERLNEEKVNHPNLEKGDPHFERITQLLDGKVGLPYSDSDLKARFKEASVRYEDKVPPGFAERKTKKGNERFGDYVLWKQLIDYAKANNKSIVFVTDDLKEDWWRDFNGKTLGPRPELIQEFRDQTKGQSFYMYSSFSFMKFIGEKLNLGVTQLTLDEATNLGKTLQPEAQSFALSDLYPQYQEDDLSFGNAIDYFNDRNIRQSGYVRELNKSRAAMLILRSGISQYIDDGALIASVDSMSKIANYFGRSHLNKISDEHVRHAFNGLIKAIRNKEIRLSIIGIDIGEFEILKATKLIDDQTDFLTPLGLSVLRILCES